MLASRRHQRRHGDVTETSTGMSRTVTCCWHNSTTVAVRDSGGSDGHPATVPATPQRLCVSERRLSDGDGPATPQRLDSDGSNSSDATATLQRQRRLGDASATGSATPQRRRRLSDGPATPHDGPATVQGCRSIRGMGNRSFQGTTVPVSSPPEN